MNKEFKKLLAEWNVKMLKREIKIYMAQFLGLFTAMATHAQSAPLYQNTISIQVGGYQLKSSKSTLSSFGSLNLQYDFHFSEKWFGSAGYQFIVDAAGGFSSLVSGFDIGANYYLVGGGPVRSDVVGMVEVIEEPKLGIAIGAGFSSRSFQLATQSIGYSGPFLSASAHYYLARNWKLVSTAQYLSLSAGQNELSAQVIGLGLGMDF